MSLFGKKSFATPGEPVLVGDQEVVTLDKFDRVVEQCYRLRDAGVTAAEIEARASQDETSFNTALENLYKENFNAQTPV